MKISEMENLFDFEVLSSFDCSKVELVKCLGSDMMSDVLAYAEPGALLITGLTNSQSVRTADIADAAAILYIRGKKPDEHTVKLADEMGVPVLSTKLGMFEVCGILHAEGIKGIC